MADKPYSVTEDLHIPQPLDADPVLQIIVTGRQHKGGIFRIAVKKGLQLFGAFYPCFGMEPRFSGIHNCSHFHTSFMIQAVTRMVVIFAVRQFSPM